MAFNFTTIKSWIDEHGVTTSISLIGGLAVASLLWFQREDPVCYEAADEVELVGAFVERLWAAGITNQLSVVDTITADPYAFGEKGDAAFRWNRFITTNIYEHGTRVVNAIGHYPRRPDLILNAMMQDNLGNAAYRLAVLKQAIPLYWVDPDKVDDYVGAPAAVLANRAYTINDAWWNRQVGTNLASRYGLAPQESQAVLPYLADTNMAGVVYISSNVLNQWGFLLSRLRYIQANAYPFTPEPSQGYWAAEATKENTADWDANDNGNVDRAEEADFLAGMKVAADAAAAALPSLTWRDDGNILSGWGSYVTLVISNYGGPPLRAWAVVAEKHSPTTLYGDAYSAAIDASATFYYAAKIAANRGPYLHPKGLATNTAAVFGAPVDARSCAFLDFNSHHWVSNSIAPWHYAPSQIMTALDSDAIDWWDWKKQQRFGGWIDAGMLVVYDYAFTYMTSAAAFWGDL